MLASSQLPHYKDSLTSQNPSLPEPGVIFPPSPVASDEKLSLGVAGALQLLEDHRGGKLNKAWNTIQLLPGDYDELWWHIERDDALFRYVTTKVHLDYDPTTLQFVVRMLSPIHQILLALTEQDILNQLSIISAGNDSAATLAQEICPLRSTTVRLQDGSIHDPDTQFKHNTAKYPGLIIEIACPHTKTDGGKNLAKLADHYVIESSGNIRMIIGIAAEYRGTKRATISIWGPKYGADQEGKYLATEETVISQEFRMTDGTGVAERALRIQLKSFLPHALRLNFPPKALEQEIAIPYEKLATYLNEAEAQYELCRAKQGVEDALSAGRRKRRRESPPEGEN